MIKYRVGHVSINVSVSNFPGGEVKVDINVGSKEPEFGVEELRVYASLKTSDDVMALLLTVDALRRHYPRAEMDLLMPYVPYARQDRPCVNGEALSIAVFANLINSCGFSTVYVLDAHSDVAPALIKNCVNLPQTQIFSKFGHNFADHYIVAPDAGAYKKAHKLATFLGARGVICANKIRDVSTGKIEGVSISDDVAGLNLLVADDICDGGRTFIELGKILRERGCASLKLVVTHGLFTKGIDVVAEHYDVIYTTNAYWTDPPLHSKVRWIEVV